jgi:hypothetical protein
MSVQAKPSDTTVKLKEFGGLEFGRESAWIKIKQTVSYYSSVLSRP